MYVGAGEDENWAALFALMVLFKRLAEEVGAALGYAYPAEQYVRAIAYLQGVERLTCSQASG